MIASSVLFMVAAGTVTVGGDFFVRSAHPVSRLGPGPVVVNLEGGLCASGPSARKVSGRWRLCLDEKQTLKQLKAAGVSAVVRENNHAADGGSEGEAKLRASLKAAGIGVIDVATPWCHKDAEGELCFFAVAHDWSDDAPDDDSPNSEDRPLGVKAVTDRGARAVLIEHYTEVAREEAVPDEMVEPGPVYMGPDLDALAVVIGIGGHEARPIEVYDVVGEDPRPAYFRDLGDLVIDCKCSAGKVGMLVDIPTGPGKPITARLVAAAHGAGAPIGRPPKKAELQKRLVEAVGLSSTAYVIDGHIELWRMRRAPASQPASRPR